MSIGNLRVLKVLPTAALLWAAVAGNVGASTVVEGDDQVVASRGGVSVTLAEIDAKVMELPADLRSEYLNNPQRIEDTISAMLMDKQLAARAVELGVEKNPYYALQVKQAETRYLAARARVLSEQSMEVPDFSELAQEKYLANPGQYTNPEMLELTHVLVSETGRTSEDARKRAEEARKLALEGKRDFASIVAEFTDEKRKTLQSDGKLHKVTRGAMVPEFEEAAFALKKPGDISPVIKTEYGYHVIRLDERQDATKLPFDAVKGKLMADLRKSYIDRNKSYLGDSMRSMKLEANPELVGSLRERYTADGPKGAPARVAAATSGSAAANN